MSLTDEATAQSAREQLLRDCEKMKRLLHGLLDSKGRVAEEIHAIRKLGKSLRGGFTLFRLDKSAAINIQAIGRLLSAPRDAVSRFHTWTKLGWVGEPTVTAAINALLEQQTHSAARRPPPEAIAWCAARVDAACAELLAVPADSLPARMRKGLAKLGRRALARCRKLDHRREEDFHKARKALKAWLGAVGFVPDGPAPDPLPHDLAEWLGDENDLATLSLWLDEHGFTARFVPELSHAIRDARRKLQRKVIKESARMDAALGK